MEHSALAREFIGFNTNRELEYFVFEGEVLRVAAEEGNGRRKTTLLARCVVDGEQREISFEDGPLFHPGSRVAVMRVVDCWSCLSHDVAIRNVDTGLESELPGARGVTYVTPLFCVFAVCVTALVLGRDRVVGDLLMSLIATVLAMGAMFAAMDAVHNVSGFTRGRRKAWNKFQSVRGAQAI